MEHMILPPEGKLGIFLSGAFMMGLFICSLFFWKSWHKTRDRLFAAFAWAFLLMALERLPLLLIQMEDESKSIVHLLRLVGFSLILYAIAQKNRWFMPKKFFLRRHKEHA